MLICRMHKNPFPAGLDMKGLEPTGNVSLFVSSVVLGAEPGLRYPGMKKLQGSTRCRFRPKTA